MGHKQGPQTRSPLTKGVPRLKREEIAREKGLMPPFDIQNDEPKKHKKNKQRSQC